MGKLAELRDLRNNMDWDHPDRAETEKKINDIEQWCIDNGNKYITKLTVWREGQGKKRQFGFYEDDGYHWVDNILVKDEESKVVTGHYVCDKCNKDCIHHILYNWCVVCKEHPQVVHYHS